MKYCIPENICFLAIPLRVECCVLVVLEQLACRFSLTFLPPSLSDEIGLIPCPEVRYNRSPIVLVENKLGVESWCVKYLLPYVHNKLLLYRQRKQWLDREGKKNNYLFFIHFP